MLKPFEELANSRLRFVMDLFISFYLYLYILLCDYNQALDTDVLRKYSSWGLVFVLGGCALVNICIYLRIAYFSCTRASSNKCKKWTLKRKML